jgi:putative radical SAM enzyme (TIGR03279 family)
MSHPTVLEVVPGSPAAAAGIGVGDELVAIDGVIPTDVIEYQELVDDADPTFTVLRGGIEIDLPTFKPEGHPVGLRLNASIFDRVQTCDNHCEFCFIYQLPPGMRQSLYLKDDDYRLSFLYGNFTTLTRFTELDVARVIEERLDPLYVSIHATDPAVRADMLRNPRGATSLRWLRALLDHGMTIHGQAVLCPGINNGSVLEQTCAEILTRYRGLATVGIVPLGLSRFNTEERLAVHTPEEARSDLEIIHFWQEQALRRLGRRMFFASDELYLRAGLTVPESTDYEDFLQHENGIGMIRAFYDELDRLERGTAPDLPLVSGEWRTIPAAPDEGYRAVRHLDADPPGVAAGPAVVITGEHGAAALEPVRSRLEHVAGRELRLLAVENRFFGGNTAVAGLLVGADVRRALERDTGPAGVYVLPDVALSGDVFLDDVALDDVAGVAQAPLRVAAANALGLIEGAAG